MAEIITQAKFDELSKKLYFLETERRNEISAAIKLAKEFGDLSENAEYTAAKDEQVANETEIARLSDTLAHAIVINESDISTEYVGIGTKVKILDVEENEELEYFIVSSLEAASRENKISDQSPIGQAIIGKRKGSVVTARTPAGNIKLKILEISK